MAKLSVRIHDMAQPKLRELQMALEQDEGQKPTSYEQVVSALIYGITLPMARGMVVEFNRDSAKAEAAAKAAAQAEAPSDEDDE